MDKSVVEAKTADRSGGPVLEVRNLRTVFRINDQDIRAVDDASFTVPRGKILAIVGESGCGKSVTAYSILRLIEKPGRIAGGQILFHSRDGSAIDIAALPERAEQLYRLRGELVSMIFQEPMTALSPVHTIGNQICEAILLHQHASRASAERRAAEILKKVGIPNAAERLRQYPHEMSGGMRQRVVIAMALVCNPELLIADEPTTAVDVTIQAQILLLVKSLQRGMGTSVILITHDLGVVAQTADLVAVMYLGRIIEQAPVRELMKTPRHPYTRALLGSLPSLNMGRDRLPSIEGSVPSLWEIPDGCPFHTRCPHARAGRCDVGGPPAAVDLSRNHSASCLRVNEIGGA